MLVLTRKAGEQILVGEDIIITVLESRRDGVRIGIQAPRGVRIQRNEIIEAVTEANVEATQADPEAESRIKALLAHSRTPEPGEA
jgi:carbon storage regulator